MAQWLVIDNAIASVHFNRLGGWSRAAMVGICCALGTVVLGLLVISRSDAILAVFIIEGMLWMIAIPGIIHQAIRLDITSGMIVSHRLMPVTGAEAIAGYLFGPATAVFFGALGVALVGDYLAMAGGTPVDRYVACLYIFATHGVLIALIVTAASFDPTLSLGALAIIVLPFIQLTGAFPVFAPGLLLFCTPVVHGLAFSARTAPNAMAAYLAAQVLSAGLGALCFIAAVRKYRRANAFAFTPVMGSALNFLWIAASAISINHLQWFRQISSDAIFDPTAAIACSLSIAVYLSGIPMATNSRMRAINLLDANHGFRPREQAVSPTALTTLLIVATVALAFMTGPHDLGVRNVQLTILVIALSILTLHFANGAGRTGSLITLLRFAYFIFLWLIPPFIGLMATRYLNVFPPIRVLKNDAFMAVSLPVMLYDLISGANVWLLPALLVQGGFAALLAVGAFRRKRQLRQRVASATASILGPAPV